MQYLNLFVLCLFYIDWISEMDVGTGGQGGGGQLPPPQYFANQKNYKFKNSDI